MIMSDNHLITKL
jgi:3-oxoacyl-[acyl-carrier-protein] synthase III